MRRRRAIVALIGTTVSLMMCMPTGAFAQDAQSNDDDIHTSAQLRAEAAEQNADQERQLLEEYDAGLPVEQIARRHGRTVGAIEARLSELGRRDQIQFNMR